MRRTLIPLTVILISMAVGFVISELVIRYFYPQSLGVWYKTREGLVILRPNYWGIARGVETVQEIQTNSFGMRDREHQIAKAPGTFRILLLGDSHMEALQVQFEHAFPSKLEDKLVAKSQRSIEVINAAVSGWGTDEQLTYLIRYGQKLQPDLILLAMTLHNDISDNLEENFHAFINHSLIAKPVQEIPYVTYKLWQLRAFLGAHSHFYQLFRTWWHSQATETGGQQLNAHVADLVRNEPSQRLRTGWEMTFELLRRIKSTAQEVGAEPVIFLIPLSLQLNEAKLASFIAQHNSSPDMMTLDKSQQLMRKFGEDEKITVIDLLPCFHAWIAKHGKPLFLQYDGHWTEAGHELAADVVSSAIVSTVVYRSQRQQVAAHNALKTAVAPHCSSQL